MFKVHQANNRIYWGRQEENNKRKQTCRNGLLSYSSARFFPQWQESRDGIGVEGRHWAASWANGVEDARQPWVFHSGKNENAYDKY
jgi:hypothetical protein